jgi:2-octaprenyl-6-methoxyphenol hydroxylase
MNLALLHFCQKKNKNTSSVILSLKNRYAEKLQDDRLLEFLHAKTHRARHIGEILEIPSKICRYPLAMKYMKQQLHGNMIFIGDSFHAVHPVLGQGFNMSLKDIQKLCNHV